MTDALSKKLSRLPAKPGVYLHKDADGKILYVGKAKSLKSRVRSYFQKGADHDPKTRILVSKIADVDWIVTRSEVEALLTESNFIKHHRPPYNVVLRDDKHYQFIKITDDTWPRVTTARNTEDRKAKYFGPYTNGWAVRQTLKTLRRIFPYCVPNDHCDDTSRKRPCLYYDLGLCPSPQYGHISTAEYRRNIEGIIRVLNGQADEVLAGLRTEMAGASRKQQYERAGQLRDQVASLEALLEGQQAVDTRPVNRDAVGLARDQGHAIVVLVVVRRGRVIARKQFSFWGTGKSSDTEVLDGFLAQYYKAATDLPDEVLVPFASENDAPVATYLTERRSVGGRRRRVTVEEPKRGNRRKLLDLARVNAEERLRQVRDEWVSDEQRTTGALEELQRVLKLPERPVRIECYDISHQSGTTTVGSMTVFLKGKPAPAHYRRFRIKHVVGVDDYASMQEVLRRRFRRLAEPAVSGSAPAAADSQPSDASFAAVPELVVIDGGKGQVAAAAQALAETGADKIPLIGLAKRFEDVYQYDPRTARSSAVSLAKDSVGSYLLQRIRDEAHRFAITYGRNLRRKRAPRSALDDLPGIGPTRKKQLLRKFGSVKRIKQASLAELEATIGKAAGKIVKENL